MESLFVEEEVLSCPNRITAEKAITFGLAVGSHSHFYRSFWRPFSLEYLWNPYSVKKRSGCARPE